MSKSVPPLRWLALLLMQCARRLLPTTRSDWNAAMHSELDRVVDDRDALVWACGCVLASFRERINVMFFGNLKIARWVLTVEMLLCFLPLTMGWLDAIGGDSGIVRLNMHIIRTDFAGVNMFALAAMFASATLGAVGPIGLIAAFRLIVFSLPVRGWVGRALVIGPVLSGTVTVVARLAIGGPESFSPNANGILDFCSAILLLSILPALGAAHLLRLGPPSAGPSDLAPEQGLKF
jgi:hypothetical protein